MPGVSYFCGKKEIHLNFVLVHYICEDIWIEYGQKMFELGKKL